MAHSKRKSQVERVLLSLSVKEEGEAGRWAGVREPRGTSRLSAAEVSVTGGVDAQTSALGYFITPCVGILMSIVCYLSLPHLVSLILGWRTHNRASQMEL